VRPLVGAKHKHYTKCHFCDTIAFMSKESGSQPDKYSTTDPERLASIDSLVSRILAVPSESLVPSGWEDEDNRAEEGMEIAPDWKVVPNPWEGGVPMEAATMVSEDPDYSTRDFSIAQRASGNRIRVLASFYRVTSDQLLMMPADREIEKSFFTLVPWDGEDADQFLTVSEQLFGNE
jgi:hypothetical protein